jgi:tight adherence protein C
MRFTSTLTKRKTSNSEQKSIGNYITDFIEQFNLQNLFKVDQIKSTLSDTGKSTTMTLDSILLAKVAMPILVGTICFNFKLVGMIISDSNPKFGLISAILSIGAGVLTFPVPDILIQLDAKKRASEFMKTFPSILDLLIICIQSGISFEHSLQRVTAMLRFFRPSPVKNSRAS